MKKKLTFITSIIVLFLIWQATIYLAEPQIVEILPVRTTQITTIDPNYPEPVRIVFDKPISTEEAHFSIKPYAKLKPEVRLVRLRSKKDATLYPAYVLSNTQELKENTTYEVDIYIKQKSIFDYWFPKKTKVLFKTSKKDNTLPKESGEDLDKRLFGK